MDWSNIKSFIVEHSKIIISIGVVILITFILIIILKAITAGAVKRARNRRAITLARLVQSIIRYVILLISIIVIIGLIGYDITTVLAGAGIVGIVIGLGAQSLINDLLSGLAIVFEDYCDIDDIVEVKGFKGKVVEIGLRSTKIQNWRGELKIITNGEIKELTNFSRAFSVALVEINVDYQENIEEVINLLTEKLQSIKEFFPQIFEGPNVLGVTNLNLNGFVISISAKTLSEEHYTVERGLRKRIIELFEENNIKTSIQNIKVVNDSNER